LKHGNNTLKINSIKLVFTSRKFKTAIVKKNTLKNPSSTFCLLKRIFALPEIETKYKQKLLGKQKPLTLTL
jgi:hypothetical protein